MTTTHRKRTPLQQVIYIISLGTIVPAFYIALAFVYQHNLGQAINNNWWYILLIFGISALANVLPRLYPYLVFAIVFLASVWFAHQLGFGAFPVLMFALAGLFFGMCMRLLIVRNKRSRERAAKS